MKVLIIGGGCGLGELMIGGVFVGSVSNVELSVDVQEELLPRMPDQFLPMRATLGLEYKGTKVKRRKGKKARW